MPLFNVFLWFFMVFYGFLCSWSFDSNIFWPWLQKSTKWHPGILIWIFVWLRRQEPTNEFHELGFKNSLATASELDEISSRTLDLSIFWARLQQSTKWLPGDPIQAFSGLGSRSRQNGFQEMRFKHFLALAPEVDEIVPRQSNLNIFWPWLQKSTKWVPGGPI